MWDALKQSDIAQARQDLEQRRAEIMRRHEEELKELDNEQGDIEKLERLLEAFAEKFKGASPASPRNAVRASAPSDSDQGEPTIDIAADANAGDAEEDEPAVAEDGSVVETRRSRGGDSSSNFDVFSRAISKTL